MQPHPGKWVIRMDHSQFRWLQSELSRLLSQVLGEEVRLTATETLRVLWVLKSDRWQGPADIATSYR